MRSFAAGAAVAALLFLGLLGVAAPERQGEGGGSPHLAGNAALIAAPTARFPEGVWRNDYAAGFGAPPEFFSPQTGSCAANGFASDGGSCQDDSAGDGNSWKGRLPPAWDVREWGLRYPLALYVAPKGSDDSGANTCVLAAAPCRTLQHAVDAIGKFDLAGQNPQLNVGGGAYFPAGFRVSGTILRGTELKVVGTGGSAHSGIANVETGICNAVAATQGGYVYLEGMHLETTCPRGSDVFASELGHVEIGPDVVLAGAPVAKLYAEDTAMILVDGTTTMSGNSDYGVLSANTSDVRFFTGFGGVVRFVGSPTWKTAFLAAVNNSHIKTGGVRFAGASSGQRYALAQNSSVDTEGENPVGGSTQGAVSGSSTYPSGRACIGGAVDCVVGTVATGLGVGWSAAVASNSDYQGTVVMTAGRSAAARGTIYVVPYSRMSGCTASLNPGGTGIWQRRATVFSNYGEFGQGYGLQLTWHNDAAPLAAGFTYEINYVCH